ncbi:MAG: tetrahydrofolate dehydrogenase/cyclohydrolase catalytic domain-containing protein [Bacteroidota bacterium]|jgi:methylenetetrahydrofolate dehydrogenase (NADP+)/methenyltetrahydrofolate cyclohydrolase|nr:bifunctional 5,10-methylene-tetrahydrofolate dehydrogenase/5,10-methylene-tetrahydrofolate cyclohydrolase [Bacteroidales bacterium]MDI9535816.1 tetrahydrofolate dehydrogenase/cyclohydrolase catalytic domain-containing protein [Bacteroidota bacterium]OQC45676.1 MAG: Bifunctional protein FolD protein [Bacteroidetes bacterium ADurb.Bin028]NLP20374.1 bifunctional 5,10-methylene-tetrahydrofolate dehydrogenase/5,10-methylene-tetrahydrofolate cyclohydrolase [Bacteroidales bacterium]HNY44233.1 tetra
MELIDGNKVAKEIKEEIKIKALQIKQKCGRAPHLAAILVGNDPGSESYVNYKMKDCEEVGFESSLIRLEENAAEEELYKIIDKLNSDPLIDGFIVQLPLPKQFDSQKVIELIDPQKDVDGFHPINVGKMTIDLDSFKSATPMGITILLNKYGIETSGKHCVIIGRSNIVGRPLSILMSQKAMNSTVTVVHSKTKNIAEICRHADILMTAMGSPKFVTADMVKEGAVVIDVGTTMIESNKTKSGYKLTGDVDFENVAEKCSYITPVPGGVGPMTRVALLLNTLKAAEQNIKK